MNGWVEVGYWLYILFFVWVLLEAVVWVKDWWRYEQHREQVIREALRRDR